MNGNDDDLTPPLEFKIFVPCDRELHHECAGATSTHICACWCHDKEQQKRDQEDLNEADAQEDEEQEAGNED